MLYFLMAKIGFEKISQIHEIVRTDRVSRSYDIKRGTKQGDPLSSLLFNSLLEDITREVKPMWVQKRMGLQLGYTDLSQLTNLRFADDLILFSTSLTNMRKMLADLSTAAGRRSLELHPEKTKIVQFASGGDPRQST
jgi:hypothetical protein